MPLSSLISFCIFLRGSHSSEAYLAERTPGAPHKASTSSPVSSAKHPLPHLFHRYCALERALPSSVSSSSGISSVIPSSRGVIKEKESPIIPLASLSLC